MAAYIGLAARLVVLACIALPLQVTHGQSKLLDILEKELNREFQVLSKEETPPYFMSYTVTEVYEAEVGASFGVLNDSDSKQNRQFNVEVRVGDYTMDNTREIRGDMYSGLFDRLGGAAPLPVEDANEAAIRTVLWKETNKMYRQALQRYAKVKSNVAVKVEAEDTSDDFSRIPEVPEYNEKAIDVSDVAPDLEVWASKVKMYSKEFLALQDAYDGGSRLSFRLERKYFVSTEGAKIVDNRMFCQLFLSARIKADDGMELPLYQSYSAFTPSELPSDDQIVADAKSIVAKLQTLKAAPVVDPFTGPAILSGRAAGVFFHEIFGHRIEGHRQKKESEGQTFKKKSANASFPNSSMCISILPSGSLKEPSSSVITFTTTRACAANG